MGVEIERKFLVRSDAWRSQSVGVLCRQGYLASTGTCTLRVRIMGEKGFLTVKGPTTGMQRAEFEYEIPLQDADALLSMSETALVEKKRYRIPFGDVVWEVDEFLGDNAGLVVAEVELHSEEQQISLPAWVGKEVTDDHRYRNVHLARMPYRLWTRDSV